jgi:hypothetical protein
LIESTQVAAIITIIDIDHDGVVHVKDLRAWLLATKATPAPTNTVESSSSNGLAILAPTKAAVAEAVAAAIVPIEAPKSKELEEMISFLKGKINMLQEEMKHLQKLLMEFDKKVALSESEKTEFFVLIHEHHECLIVLHSLLHKLNPC